MNQYFRWYTIHLINFFNLDTSIVLEKKGPKSYKSIDSASKLETHSFFLFFFPILLHSLKNDSIVFRKKKTLKIGPS